MELNIKDLKNVISLLDINPLNSLEENYNKCLDFFRDKGFNPYIPQHLNDMLCCSSFSKIFNIYEDDIKNTIFVFNEHLTDEKISLVLSSFTPPHEKSRVFFISSYPLPDILRFLHKNNNQSFFEFESIRILRNLNELKNNSALVEYYYNSSLEPIKSFFQIEQSNEIPKGIKDIENIIINVFRNENQYDTIYDIDIDYFPHYSLTLLGFCLVYILIHNLNGELFYDSEKDLKELGVGFSVNNNEIIDIMANPINKVFNFYLYGKDSSIMNWVYEIKYYLKNPDKIIKDS